MTLINLTAENFAVSYQGPRFHRSHSRISNCIQMNYSARVLLVDDFAPWRKYIRSVLSLQPEFALVAEASDGREAVRAARELQPELILLDIGLPNLHGIEAVRWIRRLAPKSKVVFLSDNRDWDIVCAALKAGGHCYVAKTDSATQLILGMRAALKGERFLSSSILPRNSSLDQHRRHA